MLSSILNSNKAVDVNIVIMRAFVMLRQYALTYKDLAEKLEILANKFDNNDKQFNDVFEALNLLLHDKEEETDFEKRERIGFQK